MILYTVASYDNVFPPPRMEPLSYRRVSGRLCAFSKNGEGYRLERLFSTDPKDFLDSRFFPGAPGDF